MKPSRLKFLFVVVAALGLSGQVALADDDHAKVSPTKSARPSVEKEITRKKAEDTSQALLVAKSLDELKERYMTRASVRNHDPKNDRDLYEKLESALKQGMDPNIEFNVYKGTGSVVYVHTPVTFLLEEMFRSDSGESTCDSFWPIVQLFLSHGADVSRLAAGSELSFKELGYYDHRISIDTIKWHCKGDWAINSLMHYAKLTPQEREELRQGKLSR